MHDVPQTRQSLLLQLRSHSRDAWAEFLAIYEDAIYGYCRRRGLQDADARDVTQEVLAAVDRRIADWVPDPACGSFRGWLFRVARNQAVDKFLEQSRAAAGTGDTRMIEMLAAWPDPASHATGLWQEYRRRLLDWAAQQVRPQVSAATWQAFWATAVEGHKPDDVARALGLSVGSVYTAKCRVVARMRELVSRLDDDIDGIEGTMGSSTWSMS